MLSEASTAESEYLTTPYGCLKLNLNNVCIQCTKSLGFPALLLCYFHRTWTWSTGSNNIIYNIESSRVELYSILVYDTVYSI